MTDPEFDDAADTVHELVARAQAAIADAEAEENGTRGGAIGLWTAVYGTVRLSGRDLDGVRADAARVVGCKVVAASILASYLAREVADLEGISPVEVLDRAGRKIAEFIHRESGSTGIDHP